jgi:hypothetical protein
MSVFPYIRRNGHTIDRAHPLVGKFFEKVVVIGHDNIPLAAQSLRRQQ